MLVSTKHQYESATGLCLGKSFPLFFSGWWFFWAKYLWLAVFFLYALWIYHLQACKDSAETPIDTLCTYVTIRFVCDLACGNSLFSCCFQIFVLIFKSLIIMYLCEILFRLSYSIIVLLFVFWLLFTFFLFFCCLPVLFDSFFVALFFVIQLQIFLWLPWGLHNTFYSYYSLF